MSVTNKRRPPEDIQRGRLAKVAKRAAKAAKKLVFDELCSKIVIDQMRLENEIISYGLVSKLVQETTPVYP